jgi:hypothetical protein
VTVSIPEFDPTGDDITASRWRSDGLAIAFILTLAGITIGYLWHYDMWLARIDLLQQLVPYYGYLGEQLRNFNIPGWNPYQLSGMPFAADPLSGWTQWPVMVLFTILPPATAMKALVGFNVILAALSTYVLGRVLGMNIPAATTGSIAFALGSCFLQFNSYCCNMMGNFAPWVPLSLLGIELAVRRERRIERVAAVALTGIGLSQMLASFVGQGTYYAILLISSYGLYRIVIAPPNGRWDWKQRATNLVGIGAGIAVAGFSLAAAGFLPRLDISGSTTLKGGHYEIFEGPGDRGWRLWQMLNNSLNSEFVARRVYIGTAVIVLALLAPFLARRKYSVPYFFIFSLVCAILMLFPTIVHEPFYLLPRFKAMHSHTTYRILAIGMIGPAMLAAASVDRLTRIKVRPIWLAILPIPWLFYWVVRDYLADVRRSLPEQVWVTLAVTTVLVAGILILRMSPSLIPRADRRIKRGAELGALAIPWLLILLIFADSTGKDITDALRGGSSSEVFQRNLDNRAHSNNLIRIYTQCSDPGGAGEFLDEQLAARHPAPFRYFGFDPIGLRTADGEDGSSYHGQQGSAQIQALLVATRATCLNLYDLQGYSPTQLQRYSDFLVAINGAELNYHDAAILGSGITSPLLNLLNPQYVITPFDIPADRTDLQYVTSTMTEVFNNGVIRVFQNPDVEPHAWLVHEAMQLPQDQILGQLTSGRIDPMQTVLIEDIPPSLAPSTGATESVSFQSYEPDEMSLEVTANSDSMLVLSEVYAKGWNAYVDGKQVPIYAADYALRGIAVPSGTHTVELRYELRSLTIGVIVSVLAFVALIAIAVALAWDIRSRRQHR